MSNPHDNFPPIASRQPKLDLIDPQGVQTFFSFFWGVAIFFNLFRQGPSLQSGAIWFLSTLTLFASVILILKPSDKRRLLILSFLGSVFFLFHPPQMPNHFLIMGLVNISIFVCWVFLRINGKIDKNWFSSIAPLVRLSVVIIYGFAVLAKFNSGFFDSKLSCAVQMASLELNYLGLDLRPETLHLAPFFVLGAEFLIWIGLLIARTRSFAIGLASIFHLCLSLTPFSQGLGFTFVLLGLLALFFPSQIINSQLSTIKKTLEKNWLNFLRKPLKVSFVLLAIFFSLISSLFTEKNLIRTISTFQFSLGILVCIASYFLYLCIKFRSVRFDQRMSIYGFPQILLLSIVILLGLSPYMGLKTAPTFTMFSNLLLEDNNNNHFFLPDFFDNSPADDIVTILGSSNQRLQSYADNGIKMNYLELQRVLKRFPSTQISFERNGRVTSLSEAAKSSELVNPNALLLKLLSFRKIYPTNQCVW